MAKKRLTKNVKQINKLTLIYYKTLKFYLNIFVGHYFNKWTFGRLLDLTSFELQ